MPLRSILNTSISEQAATLLDTIKEVRKLSAEEVLDTFTAVQQLSLENAPDAPSAENIQEIVRQLRSLTTPPNQKLLGEDIVAMTGRTPLGIHIGGVGGAIENCPFGRDHVGIDMAETDLPTLVKASYAEWRTAQTHRNLVIVLRRSVPRLVYLDATWAASPQKCNGRDRDFVGRHYIASALVVNLTHRTLARTPQRLTTHKDRTTGMVDFTLTPTEEPVDSELIDYLLTHERVRPTLQQPIDKLDVG